MSEEDEQLMVDYVCGELGDEDRLQCEQRILRDADFARAVAAMEETVALGILAETPAVSPPAALRAAVLAQVEPPPLISADRPTTEPSWWLQVGWGMAAALAVLAIVLVGKLSSRSDQVDALQNQLTLARQSLEDVSDDLALVMAERTDLTARIAELNSRRSLDELRIASLSSQLEESSYGFAVFDTEVDEGVIEVVNLPAIDADHQDFQLWIVDPQYPNPVDGGVMQVGEDGRGRVRFAARQPVTEVAAFAVSLERKGGVPVAEGPMVLVGAMEE